MISLDIHKPSKALEPYIVAYTAGVMNVRGEKDMTFHVVPNGCLELIIHLNDSSCMLPSGARLESTPEFMMIGMFNHTYHVHFNEEVPIFSIRFKPEGILKLFRVPSADLLGRYADIDCVFDRDFLHLCEKIRELKSNFRMLHCIESFLIKRLREIDTASDDYVMHAMTLMRETEVNKIGELAEALNVSQRQLERKFKSLIGVSPKQYLRLIRINKVIETLRQGAFLNLTNVAYHCGYFDQSHFIRDFKYITGLTPSLYLEQDDRYLYLQDH